MGCLERRSFFFRSAWRRKGSTISESVVSPSNAGLALVSHLSQHYSPKSARGFGALREIVTVMMGCFLFVSISYQIKVCAILTSFRMSSNKLVQRTTEVAAAIKRSLPDNHNKE